MVNIRVQSLIARWLMPGNASRSDTPGVAVAARPPPQVFTSLLRRATNSHTISPQNHNNNYCVYSSCTNRVKVLSVRCVQIAAFDHSQNSRGSNIISTGEYAETTHFVARNQPVTDFVDKQAVAVSKQIKAKIHPCCRRRSFAFVVGTGTEAPVTAVQRLSMGGIYISQGWRDLRCFLFSVFYVQPTHEML